MSDTDSQAFRRDIPYQETRASTQDQKASADGFLPDSLTYTMDPISLRFQQPELEARYNAENYQRQIGLTRLSIALGAIIFAIYSVVDPFIVPDVTYEAWAIRLGIACPLLLTIVAITYLPSFNYRHQGLLSLAMVIPGLAVVGMIAVADAPGSYLYYAGIHHSELCELPMEVPLLLRHSFVRSDLPAL